MRYRYVLKGPALMTLGITLLTQALPSRAGDAARGESLYLACSGCHSLDENDVGPKHRNVVGRRAGTVPGYHYSDALRDSGIVWTEQTLDKWLTDPQTLVPGSKMFFRLQRPEDRADLIAFLKASARP